jgi:uncharacterized protein with ATP-grasp and redox domains
MRTYLDCIPCLMNQALRAARLATDNPVHIKKILDEVGAMIGDIPMESPPPVTARHVYRLIETITGIADPCHDLKQSSTRKALDLYPALKEKIARSEDPLLAAIRLAIAGNVIDFGIDRRLDIQTDIDALVDRELAVSHYGRFRSCLAAADEILYIGDNAGESVLDRMLIETLNKPVRYVVRAAPIINDVTCADALQAGIDTVATVMSSGSDAPGTVLDLCSPEFRQMFDRAEMIISKGQGNFEALSDTTAPIFFLLIAKCSIIARDIGAEIGDMILKGPDTVVSG